MLVACWSSKGGAGTTVVATTLALLLARRAESGALLADLAGDAPAVLGMTEPDDPGIAGWLAAGADVPVDALARLEQPVAPALTLLTRGLGPLERGQSGGARRPPRRRPSAGRRRLRDGADGRCPRAGRRADRSILVTRACFVSLRRALAAPIRPSEVVLLTEPGRSLTRRDVEECLGVAVVASVDVDPAVARAVDAGLLATRLPRGLVRELSHAA